MKLSQLLKQVDVKQIDGTDRLEISGVAFDSREVKPGNLFICITGFQTDGHIYAKAAAEKGAIAIVAEHPVDVGVSCVIVENSRRALAEIAAEFYGHPDQKFCLIGITGTNGKTTTTYLVKSVLEKLGKKVGLIGTNQNMIGNEVIPTKHTTPDALELMRLFSLMAEKQVEYVIMEVSSHSLYLDRVTACRFRVGAFTNITRDHLDFHKTMENYLAAKGILFHICDKGAINADDSGAEFLRENAACNTLMTYGVGEGKDLFASNIQLHEESVNFCLHYGGKEYEVDLGIPGEFSVYNAMTALSCLALVGVEMQDAVEALRAARGVKGRVETVPTGRDFGVIIDYAHTPDGLEKLIAAVRKFAKGRIITVFGCGGDRDKGKRPKMGKIAAGLSDLAVVTSDNPRSEDPEEIIRDILVGVKETDGEYVVVPNRFEAIEYALDHAQKEDVILLAGKGHETYQVLKDRTISFDEREIVRKLLGVSGQ